MFVSNSIPLRLFHFQSVQTPQSPIFRHFSLQISSTFLGSNQMGKTVNSTIKSSSAVEDSVVCKVPVMADHDNEGFIMFGTITSSLSQKKVKNISLPRSPSFKATGYKHSELISNSNHSISPSSTTNTDFKRRNLELAKDSGDKCSVPGSNFENTKVPLTDKFSKAKLSTPHNESPSFKAIGDKQPKLISDSNHSISSSSATNTGFKRRSRVDLELAKASGDKCSVPSSNFENTNKFSKAKLSTPHNESPQSNQCWSGKSDSVNRPYNNPSNSNYAAVGGQKLDSSLSKPEFRPYDICFRRRFNRPYNNPSNSNYAAVGGQKLDSSLSKPEFRPYDICFHRRRNRPSIGANVPEENKESGIEKHVELTKGSVLRPGMVILKNFISHDEQVGIVEVCRELGLGPGGFYQPGYANGAKLRLKMMCLGMDWDPQTYKYGKKRAIDGSTPPSIPTHFSELVTRAIQEAQSLTKKEYRVWNVEDVLPSMTPDICIVNSYSNYGKLGLHQDRDESRESLRKGLPVVSFSIGDSADFLYGDERDVEEAESVILESGDVLIFGGDSRHVFHGVPSVLPNSAPKKLLRDSWLSPGRLNLTFRQY